MCRWILCLISVLLMSCGGCASYATPGRAADLRDVGAPDARELGAGTDATIRQAFDKQPLAKFPTGVAVVRIQQPGYYAGYHQRSVQGWGQGRYSIVLTRDVEKPEQIERLSKLPQLQGIAPLGRLLIDGSNLNSDLPLRRAAAQLHADMLLIYTLDTVFNTENKAIPLSVVTLGLSPNKQVRLTTTASAVLLDTRTGYVYGLAEATAQENRFTNSWQDQVSIDETRRNTESAAFEKLVGELETTWGRVLRTYGGTPQNASASSN
jgi:hypothetical protein